MAKVYLTAALIFAIWATVVGSVGYIIIHFVTKFW